jgi:hypothetical protein
MARERHRLDGRREYEIGTGGSVHEDENIVIVVQLVSLI